MNSESRTILIDGYRIDKIENIASKNKTIFTSWKDFVNETIGLKNLYSKVIEGLNINDLAFIGITEEFEKSLLLFNKIFNCQKQLPAKKYNAKVNPHKESSGYIISDQTKKAITRENQKDILLYAQAKKRFEELCNIHGV